MLYGPRCSTGLSRNIKEAETGSEFRVARDLVHDGMCCVDAEVLEARAPEAKKEIIKSNFSSSVPDMVHSLDGHDKLMEYGLFKKYASIQMAFYLFHLELLSWD